MKRRRRVALFANGWAKECLQEIGEGISQCAAKYDVDIFGFVNYSIHSSSEEEQKGEFNIFCCSDLKDFDGVFLLSNSFNLQQERDYLYRKVLEAGIPAISLEYELEGIGYIGADNYSGMYDMTEHMIQEHGAKRIVFIAGIRGHADSETRMRAMLDAARENRVEVREEDILYGNWAEAPACRSLEGWMQKNGALPDAIICANDIMAIGVCDWLREKGYHVPDDVKVTGYDCISQGQEHSPVIASVSREWSTMGYKAMQTMVDKMEGRETEIRKMMKSRPLCHGSCGCRVYDEDDRQRDLGRGISAKKFNGLDIDQHFRHMYTSVRKVETLEGFHESLAHFFQQESMMEGKNFMLCIHPQFFTVDENEDIYKVPGYCEEMEVICSLKDGVAEEHQLLSTRDAIFRASERSDTAGVYIYVPVRSDDKNLGLAMLTGGFRIAGNFVLYIWTRHVNEYMEQVRSNVKIAALTKKLRELSVTDALTGLYNRMGAQRILYPFLEECQKRGGRGVVLLTDIDRMKTINDKFGHAQGDLALKTVADVLRTELPEGFRAARFGGDEFIVAGECSEELSIGGLAEKIARKLAGEVERRQITFPLSISIGGVQLKQGEPFDSGVCLQKADASMYQIKEMHHQQIDAQSAQGT